MSPLPVTPPVASQNRPVWRESTTSYLDLVAVQFKKHRELTDSFKVFFNKDSALFQAPFRSVGDNTIFIPLEAQKLFQDYVREQGFTATFSGVGSSTGRSRKPAATPAP